MSAMKSTFTTQQVKALLKALNVTWSVRSYMYTAKQGRKLFAVKPRNATARFKRLERLPQASVLPLGSGKVLMQNDTLDTNKSTDRTAIRFTRINALDKETEDVYSNTKRSNHFDHILPQSCEHHMIKQLMLGGVHSGLLDYQRDRHLTSCAYFHSMRRKNLLEDRLLSLPRQNHCVQIKNISLSPQGILEACPKPVQPYMRLIRFDKPIGTWLLYWPCTWSIAMAATPGCLPDLWLLTLFGAGSFFMRGAGCIINDMWDRDYDKKVARTKLRPLASGELTMFQGLVCLAGMLSVSLGILLQLNWYSVILGASSMILVIMYPLAKRFTYWPQAMLGVTLNWGVLISWAAIRGCVEWAVVPLYLACVFYTMIYDSIYSHQDKYDDMLIGVKSTALKFGDKTKPWLTGFSTITIGGLVTTGLMSDQTWPYFVATAITSGHLLYQIWDVDLNDADDCAAKFRSNTWLGAVMFCGVVAGTLLKGNSADAKTEQEKDDKGHNNQH